MDIRDFGGEFKLIDDIVAAFRNHHGVPLTVGDDAAVVPTGEGDFRAFTTDALVEGEHFRLDWSTPYQVGVKTLECNVSDVAAMGAVPEFLLLNLVIRDGLSVEDVREVYRGIRDGCDRYGITLLGGDTTKGPVLMLSATLTGRTKRPVLRSGAKVGDLVCVTGDVGAASAAVRLLGGLAGDTWGLPPLLTRVTELFPRLLQRHAEPRCRLDAAAVLGPVANAMIDVSDGVGSEVRHICSRSGVGAVIEAAALPIATDTLEAAATLGATGLALALSGGEDYELLCTLAPEALAAVQSSLRDLTVIGEIVPADVGVLLRTGDGTLKDLPAGFRHF
jgi:thiamine-monophosphate kinase